MEIKRVECKECGEQVHIIEAHLEKEHTGLSLESYVEKYPEAELMSELAKERLAKLGKTVGSGMVDLNINDVFGMNVFAESATIKGYNHRSSLVPKKDENYVFKKDILATVLYAIMKPNEPCLFTGPTGSGKSSFIQQTFSWLNRPLYRVNMDNDITRADWVGQWVLRGKEMFFQYGILPRAMREGIPVLIDEWDAQQPGVSLATQAVLEDDGRLVIMETGEIIAPTDGFRLFGTCNTLGMGDESGLYHGTQPQNFAQLDRFKLVEHIDYPEEDVEKDIVKRVVGITDNDVLTKLTEFATLVRRAFVKEEIRATMSTRTIISVAQKIVDFGDVKMAYNKAFINKSTGEEAKVLREFLQRTWGIS
jgi:cobaltochelatase CobS